MTKMTPSGTDRSPRTRAGLDVERLAAALPAVLNFRFTLFSVGDPKWQEIAAAIAAAYGGREAAAPADEAVRLLGLIGEARGSFRKIAQWTEDRDDERDIYDEAVGANAFLYEQTYLAAQGASDEVEG